MFQIGGTTSARKADRMQFLIIDTDGTRSRCDTIDVEDVNDLHAACKAVSCAHRNRFYEFSVALRGGEDDDAPPQPCIVRTRFDSEASLATGTQGLSKAIALRERTGATGHREADFVVVGGTVRPRTLLGDGDTASAMLRAQGARAYTGILDAGICNHWVRMLSSARENGYATIQLTT